MNQEQMHTSINKGVPCFMPIELKIETLAKECCANQDQFEKEISLIAELYRNNILEVANYTKAKETFLESFLIRTDYKTSKSTIHISPITFIEKLKSILGVSNPSVDFNDRNLAKELMDRVNILGKITTPEELKNQFPEIYSDYKLSHTSLRQIERYRKSKQEKLNNPETKSEVQDNLDRQYRLYHSFALSPDFNTFISKQFILYRNLVVRRQFIEGNSNRTSLDLSMFEGLDKEKFELYVADKYLTKAIESENDYEKQQYLFYVTTFIRENKTSTVKIHNDDGKEISLSSLMRRYRKLFRTNPLLRPIDEPREHFENYHIRHVENHVKKYFFTGVNWQIVPPGVKDDELDDKVIDSLNRRYNYLSPQERERKIIERFAIYERKKAFFDRSNYLYKIYGTNSFNGYIAYVYENGEVLMEKFFDDYAQCLPTKGEAIYNVQVTDFETLSKMSKLVLIKDKRCKRIIHTGNWEEKGQAILDKPSTPETKDAAKQLILRLKTQKAE